MFILTVVLAIVVALIFGGAGLAKIANQPAMVEARKHLAIPSALWRVIGILEVLGAIGLVVGLHQDLPVIGVLAAAGLVGMSIGATYYHQRAGDSIPQWLPAVVAGSLTIFYAIARIGSA